ncbi:undecaprenyldiphospho-muramoylpentapeptide beta-N-acetylglucosaminyltransferase [Tumebacillus lipolyticus]|uniref:UDP-N-acetylglucosamine--N-acetylmuramyl-(pentapeptide) pyrophosphoryl-undecaprenol N-acetylglucosamine transferase n=1 Tax=Tumebacillus lipolyticus TaxID=1280370 RepID=A0ABW4ZUL3_9BACL
MKKLVLTGGGSAGHVTGNLALLSTLKQAGWEIEYIGSKDGIESTIIAETGLPYHSIAVGKLRRYFDLKNFKDPFRVLQGTFQAFRLLRKIKPKAVFSKGGFVAVPVVIAAWINRIPVVIHESDLTPGLANKLSVPFANKVCVTFPETVQHLDRQKANHTGSPIRSEILRGSAEAGRAFCGFTTDKPIILAMGGSLGSVAINNALRQNLDALLQQFQIVHLCGKDNLDPRLEGLSGYRQFEYVSHELPDLFAMTDLFISRAGSNAIFEFLALKKPNLLIPLTRAQSRGDQILNARSFEKQGYSHVLFEEDLTSASLLAAVRETHDNRERYIAAMEQSTSGHAVEQIVSLIQQVAKK